MRKIAATYIFTGNGRPLKNGIIVCENDGTVFDIIDSSGNLSEQTGLEFYSGILIPGFVNICCQFELSHLQGVISEKTVINSSQKETNHIKSVVFYNNGEIFYKFNRKMLFNGIVAVGDISDTLTTVSVRSKIKYHNIKLFVPQPNNLGFDFSHQKNSLEYTSKIIQVENRIFLIDSTFFEEIEMLKNCCTSEQNFLILCPISSLLIGNQLPPVEFFRHKSFHICIGTYSLGSNHNISILDEMLVLQQNFPELTLEELIKYVCLNSAQALKIDDWAGSFEKGKKPGINLISGIDFKNMKLTENSKIKRLI